MLGYTLFASGLSGIAVSDWRIAIFRDSPPRCIKGFEKSGLARERVIRVQTPQAYRREILGNYILDYADIGGRDRVNSFLTTFTHLSY